MAKSKISKAAAKRAVEETPLERLFKLMEEKSVQRGKHVLAIEDLSQEIIALASEARKHNTTMNEVRQHVKRMDRKQRVLVPITRQALDTALATYEERREPRTTRESRRRRDAEESAGGSVNVEALS